MSLRTFHLVFITLSTVMCLSAAALIQFVAPEESWAVPGMAASLVSAVSLIVYGRMFLRKYGHILPKM